MADTSKITHTITRHDRAWITSMARVSLTVFGTAAAMTTLLVVSVALWIAGAALGDSTLEGCGIAASMMWGAFNAWVVLWWRVRSD